MDQLYPKFIVIELPKCNEKRTWIQKVFRMLSHYSYDADAIKRLNFNANEIMLIGTKGLRITLPFPKNEVKEIPEDYLDNYIRKILDLYDIPGCYLSRELSFLNSRFDMNKKWIFEYLFFKEGITLFLEKCGIQKKTARFVVIDSGNKKVETILQIILEYTNYLTIVTNRVEHFKNAVEVVYEETGLMMEVVSAYTQKNIMGNVVINLDRDCYRIYSNFEQDAYVMDLEFTDKKLDYLANRRKDLTILYDYDFLIDGQKLEKELAAEILVRDNWKLSRFVKRTEMSLTASELETISNYYKLQIQKMKILSMRK